MERERIEKERQEKIEKERQERQMERERIEKERQEKIERERQERERQEKERQEKLEKERQEKIEREKQERERKEKERKSKENIFDINRSFNINVKKDNYLTNILTQRNKPMFEYEKPIKTDIRGETNKSLVINTLKESKSYYDIQKDNESHRPALQFNRFKIGKKTGQKSPINTAKNRFNLSEIGNNKELGKRIEIKTPLIEKYNQKRLKTEKNSPTISTGKYNENTTFNISEIGKRTGRTSPSNILNKFNENNRFNIIDNNNLNEISKKAFDIRENKLLTGLFKKLKLETNEKQKEDTQLIEEDDKKELRKVLNDYLSKQCVLCGDFLVDSVQCSLNQRKKNVDSYGLKLTLQGEPDFMF